MENVKILRILRALHKDATASAANIAAIEDANSRLAYAAGETPDHAPNVGNQPVYDYAAKTQAAYAAFKAQHPDLVAEYETRYEIAQTVQRRDNAQAQLDRLPNRYLRIPKPTPAPTDDHLATLTQAHAQAQAAYAQARDTLATLDPLDRLARTLPARVQRLRDAEGQAALRLARARQRHEAAVAAHAAADPVRMRRALDMEAVELEQAVAGYTEEIATLTASLPAGPARAPLRAARADGRPRAPRSSMPHAATDPQGLADLWGRRLDARALDRYRYDPDTGVLSSVTGRALDPACDTVGVRDRARRLVHVPKGVCIALLHLDAPHYLVPTSQGADRWAWRHLVAPGPRDTLGRTVRAAALTATAETLA